MRILHAFLGRPERRLTRIAFAFNASARFVQFTQSRFDASLRRRLLLRAPRGIAVQPVLRAWLDRARAEGLPRAARIDIDIDPISFL